MKQLGHFYVAIMVHSCSSRDFSSASVSLLPAGDSSGHAQVRLFDPPKLQNISQVGDAVMSWTRSKVNATYLPRFLNGFPQHLELPAGNLIADMSRAGAIEGSPYESPFHVIHADDGSAEKLEILERLTDVGFAMAQFLDDTRSAWLLKAEALSHCCLALHLKSPQPVFAAPTGLPALTWTRLEGLCYLSNQGWQLQFLSSREEKGSMMPLKLTQRSSDDKVICVYRGDLKQHYVTCLSFVQAQKSLCGQPEELQHFQTATYYAQLLGLQTKKQQQLTLPDSEEGHANMFFQAQETEDAFLALQDGQEQPAADLKRVRRRAKRDSVPGSVLLESVEGPLRAEDEGEDEGMQSCSDESLRALVAEVQAESSFNADDAMEDFSDKDDDGAATGLQLQLPFQQSAVPS